TPSPPVGRGELDLAIRDRRELLALVRARHEDLPSSHELEAHVPELDDVARFDDAPAELDAVDANPVGRRLVDDFEPSVAQRMDFTVEAGDGVVIDGNSGLFGAPHAHAVPVERVL